jgi:hypothetical protein
MCPFIKEITMAGPGKPAWVLTPEILQYVEEQSRKGVTEASIARNVGLHPSTFSEKKQQYPEIAEAIKKGNAVGEELAVNALWAMIQDPKSKGHVTATLFYLKCKHAWNDGSKNTLEVQAPSGVKFDVIPKGQSSGVSEES